MRAESAACNAAGRKGARKAAVCDVVQAARLQGCLRVFPHAEGWRNRDVRVWCESDTCAFEQAAWNAAMASPQVIKELEDGVKKLWVTEPTRMRGEKGVEKRVGCNKQFATHIVGLSCLVLLVRRNGSRHFGRQAPFQRKVC